MNETEKAFVARRLFPLYDMNVNKPTSTNRRSESHEEKGQRQEVLKCRAAVRASARQHAQPPRRNRHFHIIGYLAFAASVSFVLWVLT